MIFSLSHVHPALCLFLLITVCTIFVFKLFTIKHFGAAELIFKTALGRPCGRFFNPVTLVRVCVCACVRACVRACVCASLAQCLKTLVDILFFLYIYIYNIFHLDIHYVCMLVQRFEPQGRRFQKNQLLLLLNKELTSFVFALSCLPVFRFCNWEEMRP